MVFGLPFGELIFLMVGTAVLLGPKDLPILARAIGRMTGRAVGYVQTARGQMDTVMAQSEASKIQKELRETMAQLDAIRHEIRSGMSIVQPSPYVRESFEMSAGHVQHGGSTGTSEQTIPSRLQQATTIMRKVESALDHFADSNGKQNSSRFEATSYARFAGPLSMIEQSRGSLHTQNAGEAEGSSRDANEIPVLPVSAVSMGIFPPRTGPFKGGSDLVLESLAERKVAQQALQFLQQPQNSSSSTVASDFDSPQKEKY